LIQEPNNTLILNDNITKGSIIFGICCTISE
jgi:hypothetical protein